MTRTSPIRSLLRRAGLPAAVLMAVGFFGYNAALGPTGVVATKALKTELAQKDVEYAALAKKRAELKNRVELLDPKRGADPDMVDELVRKQLNVARPDEVIVPLDK
ncbi:FtsB family cell division protein [Sphingomonas sp. M1-B02]|uniref:FtsB family cell division protein n=1 Tax=Sphingomonas sp. M1-B02 TaxID=3114300 RepID=UPI002240DD80|nr:septum formation initiator family protein [Sphingomonas sp. S6-11]UZK66829.1 septum formation initiator family protein [Sphingomonas sp. S6-11]